jgi:hypothetical protein
MTSGYEIIADEALGSGGAIRAWPATARRIAASDVDQQ